MDTLVKCFFCHAPSKYSCPQCTLRYCSVSCYQHVDHQSCSENFYKEQVETELKALTGTDDDKKKLLQTLANINKQSTLSNALLDTNDISVRLNNTCLDDSDEIWKQLTDDERNSFQRRIQTGNLDFLDLWQPWWEHDLDNSKVIELERSISKPNIPKILKDLPSINDILKNKQPDGSIAYNIVEIILVYCVSKRLFNGDLYDSPEDSIGILLSQSKVLGEDFAYSDLDTCIYCFIENLQRDKEISVTPVEIILKDLIFFLSSQNQAVLRALSELHTFLRRYRKWMKRNSEESDSNISHKVQRVLKKVYFFAVFVKGDSSHVNCLLPKVRELQLGMIRDRQRLLEEKHEIEANLQTIRQRKTPLIQEL